jgi:hypothetical protein
LHEFQLLVRAIPELFRNDALLRYLDTPPFANRASPINSLPGFRREHFFGFPPDDHAAIAFVQQNMPDGRLRPAPPSAFARLWRGDPVTVELNRNSLLCHAQSTADSVYLLCLAVRCSRNRIYFSFALVGRWQDRGYRDSMSAYDWATPAHPCPCVENSDRSCMMKGTDVDLALTSSTKEKSLEPGTMKTSRPNASSRSHACGLGSDLRKNFPLAHWILGLEGHMASTTILCCW